MLLRLSVLGVLVLGMAACAAPSHPLQAWRDPAVDRVWPSAPAEPRIRYLRTISPGIDSEVKGRAARLFSWLTGDLDDSIPFVAPYDVAANGVDTVWVSDTGLSGVHAVNVFSGKSSLITVADGAPLETPLGLCWDPLRKRLYVSDATRRKVFVFDGKGNWLSTLVPPEGFGRPAGLEVDVEGNLHVVDVLTGRVQVFDESGKHLSNYGDAFEEFGRLNRPTDITFDSLGRAFLSDGMNFRVVVLSPSKQPVGEIGSLGDRPGYFARPKGVAVDRAGHVYVADAAFDNIQVFDMAGNVLLFFGTAGSSPGNFNLPAGLTFDDHNRLYVVDSHNKRVQVFEYLESP